MEKLNVYVTEKLKINKNIKLSDPSNMISDKIKNIINDYLNTDWQLKGTKNAWTVSSDTDRWGEIPGVVTVKINKYLINSNKLDKINNELLKEFEKYGMEVEWSSKDIKNYEITYSIKIEQ